MSSGYPGNPDPAAPAQQPGPAGGPDWRNLLGKFGTILQTVGKVAAPAYAAGRTGNPAIAQAMWQKMQTEDRRKKMVSELARVAPSGPNAQNMRAIADVLMRYGEQDEAVKILQGLQTMDLAREKQAQQQSQWESEQDLREKEFDLERRQTAAAEAAVGKPRNQDIAGLRRLVMPEATRYKQQEHAFAMVNKSLNTPMGDLALINAYVKTIDPGSIVRTEEGRMIVQSAGVPEAIKNWISNVTGKGKLSETHAQQIRDQARVYIMDARRRHAVNMEGWDELAAHEGYDKPFPPGWYAKPVEEIGLTGAAAAAARGVAGVSTDEDGGWEEVEY